TVRGRPAGGGAPPARPAVPPRRGRPADPAVRVTPNGAVNLRPAPPGYPHFVGRPPAPGGTLPRSAAGRGQPPCSGTPRRGSPASRPFQRPGPPPACTAA